MNDGGSAELLPAEVRHPKSFLTPDLLLETGDVPRSQ